MSPQSRNPTVSPSSSVLPPPPPDRKLPQHGVNGVYYGGKWVDIEDCANTFFPGSHTPTSGQNHTDSRCRTCPHLSSCSPPPRSRSHPLNTHENKSSHYDVIVIGAGCIGGAIARELSKYQLSTLLLEAADDVSQGATKGNSGIVHAGYDDKPGTNRAKYCWKGNQMFPSLDEELRFGYQRNGSLVIARNDAEVEILKELMSRGETNGVERLQLLNRRELRDMEPAVHDEAIAALYSPDAGNVIPYEYAIALVENAVDNGVELRLRREVTKLVKLDGEGEHLKKWEVTARYWEPKEYIDALAKVEKQKNVKLILVGALLLSTFIVVAMGAYMTLDDRLSKDTREMASVATVMLLSAGFLMLTTVVIGMKSGNGATTGFGGGALGRALAMMPFEQIVALCRDPVGQTGQTNKTVASVEEMFVGGSGSSQVVKGVTVREEVMTANYVINCAGGASDVIAKMMGDDSFYIKPRLGDYLLLNRNQGYLTSKTIFPCPDPVLGKGVLVQTTLWGNLILGPTARDMHNTTASTMTPSSIHTYILSKCRQLIPYFDPRETFHAFCGARAKNSRGDWIIERSAVDGNVIHVAGIDSPGLAGSPAIALEVVRLLKDAGCAMPTNDSFNPNRAPIIAVKKGMKAFHPEMNGGSVGMKMGPIGKNDSKGGKVMRKGMAVDEEEEKRMASNIICKCEKVTELEVVRALRRSIPIDSTQGIRKRTRAGMGHCQGDKDNYNCESRVKAIIARENQVPIDMVGGRPWPATSILPKRWIDDKDKEQLLQRMMT